MNRYLALPPVTALLLASCGRTWTWTDYMAIHKDGMQKLEASRQINANYGEVDNFIVNFGIRKQPLEWQTVAFVDGRFALTYVQPVTVDYSKRTVTPAGDPKFNLVAAKSVHLSPGGTVATTYERKLQRDFGKAEWDKFVVSGYDLTSLGIPKDEIHQIPNRSKSVRSFRIDRVPIE